MITIDSKWLKKDFKQKYYLFCRDSKFELKKFVEVRNKPYICRIKIETL
jgi:hypothetical protein